jgi:tripartite-type tricarboxylate transporter receptor subunit TctC
MWKYGLVVSVALIAFAPASAPAQFYAGKTVTLLVNFTAGGPTDIEARLVARHIDKHIPGKPTVIVKNMPGAGGNTGVNYLGEVAKNDPTTVGFFTWNPINQVIGGEGLRIRYEQFKLVAGIHSATVTYARTDIPPGIKKPADIVKAQPFIAAFLAPDDVSTTRLGLSLELLGAKHRLISGYKGLSEVATAVQQKEVQASVASLAAWRALIEPNLVNTGQAIALFQIGTETAPNSFARNPAISEVMTLLELYRELNGAGKTPQGPAWESIRFISRLADSMFRTVFLPPGAPDQAVKELRQAVAALWKDEAFFAEYEKTVKYRPNLVDPDEGQRVIAGMGNVDPAIVAYLKEFVARNTK